MAEFDDQVELPVEGLEYTAEEISFDDGAVNDEVVVDEVVPVASAVVVEEEEVVPVLHEEVVEETIPAPVAVVEEPTYVAPIEEPVHHVRWPWALLALPLLAIPFIPRHHTEPVPVAEPVRATTPAVVREAPKVTPVPECKGTWTTRESVVLRKTAAETGAAVETLKSGTAVDVKSSASGWYKVQVAHEDGYLPVNVVVCTVEAPAKAKAPAPVAPAPEPVATTTVTG